MQLSGNSKFVIGGGVTLVAGVAITIIIFVFWGKDSKSSSKSSENNGAKGSEDAVRGQSEVTTTPLGPKGSEGVTQSQSHTSTTTQGPTGSENTVPSQSHTSMDQGPTGSEDVIQSQSPISTTTQGSTAQSKSRTSTINGSSVTIQNSFSLDGKNPKTQISINVPGKCSKAESALKSAFETTDDIESLQRLFEEAKIICQSASTDLGTITSYLSKYYLERKKMVFSLKEPQGFYLRRLSTMQKNLKKIEPTLLPEEPMEVQFCKVFGINFTMPFMALLNDPSFPDGEKLAQEAASAFPFAKVFCEELPDLSHPAYAYSSCIEYVVETIKKLANAPIIDTSIMAYINFLRLLNHNSEWAFAGCKDLDAVLAAISFKRNGSSDEKLKATKYTEILPVDYLTELSIVQIETMQKDLEKATFTTSKESYAIQANRSLLVLSRIFKNQLVSDPMAQAWLNIGLEILEKQEFKDFIENAYKSENRIVLQVLEETSKFNLSNAQYLEVCGNFYESRKCVSQYAIVKAIIAQFNDGKLSSEDFRCCLAYLNSKMALYISLKNNLGVYGKDGQGKEKVVLLQAFIRGIREGCEKTFKSRENHKYFLNVVETLDVDEDGYFMIGTFGGNLPWNWTPKIDSK